MRHARLGVDAQLPAAIDAPGGGGEHLAHPVRSEREESLVRHGGQPLASPAGEVEHHDLLSEVKLALGQDQPPGPVVLGPYFAVKLAKSGRGPASPWKAAGLAFLGLLIAMGGFVVVERLKLEVWAALPAFLLSFGGFVPQLTVWIAYTVLVSTLLGAAVVAIMKPKGGFMIGPRRSSSRTDVACQGDGQILAPCRSLSAPTAS